MRGRVEAGDGGSRAANVGTPVLGFGPIMSTGKHDRLYSL